MKIGLVIEYLPESGKKLGGVSVAVHRLANGLVDAGHEVVVIALNQAPADARYKIHIPFKSKWLCKALSGYIGQQFYSIFLNFCHFPKADIWHFHGYDHFVLKSVGPRVRTLHGSSFREMQATTNTLRKMLMFMNYLWEHLTIAHCNRVLCIGSETASFFGLKHVVDNPFDPKVFRPSKKSHTPQIFYNGYWTGRKRGSFLYDIFVNQVLPVIPNAELVMLCNDVPEHPNVTVLKGIPDERLAQAYSTAWLFCYPSIYEGFGMAYMEAMASGTAILTSPNTGADDVLQKGTYGVIADDCNFAEVLLKLLQNEHERNQLEQLGLQRSADFHIDRVVEQHLNHYQAVLEETN